MPIIVMLSNEAESYPEGAHCVLDYPGHTSPLVLAETHVGLCLWEREANYYDDSDFFMSVWDEESQSIKEIMFATTRGWSYPCMGSRPDATPEVKAKADAWLAARNRRARITARWARRAENARLRAAMGLSTRAAVERLRRASGRYWQQVEKLMTANLRSEFRISLAKQAREWAEQEHPKFSTPFSHKQWDYL